MKIFSNIKSETDKENILKILSDIHNGIIDSQRKISKQLEISVALLNSFL